MPNFIPSSRPTSYHVLHMIFPKFMILRPPSPQPESLAFAKLISLANHKAFALTFFQDHGSRHDICLDYDTAMTMTLP